MPNLTPTRHTIADPSQLNTSGSTAAPNSGGFNHYESRIARMQQSKDAKKYEGGESEEVGTGGDSERKKPRGSGGSHIVKV